MEDYEEEEEEEEEEEAPLTSLDWLFSVVPITLGIDDEGRLVVQGGDGARMAWGAGEVHLERAG